MAADFANHETMAGCNMKLKNTIQSVVLAKTKVYSEELALTSNIAQVKFITNNLLQKLKILYEDKIDPDILFPGNPKHYLCSPDYCSLYKTCKFVNGG